MVMFHALLLSTTLAWGQHAAPPPQAPAFIAADIAQLSELLDLEPSQRDSLRMLLTDHELAWLEARARVIDDLHATGAWAQANTAESTWRAASAHSRAAHRALTEARRASLAVAADAHVLTQLRLAADGAQRTAARARASMFEARRSADPGRARLFAELAVAHDALTQDLDSSIEGMLDTNQQAQWPAARRTVRRARRLHGLGLPGAGTDLRGRVMRRVGVSDAAIQAAIDAWASETDALLDRIDALQLEARSAQDDVVAAAVFRDADRLQSMLANYTLQAAAAMEAMDPKLASLQQAFRAEAFPLTWGSTDLHMLANAADLAGDTALLALVRSAMVNYTAAIDARADAWQSTERAGGLAQLMRRRGLDADAVDAAALQRAGDAQRAMRHERDALVRAQVRVLLQSTTREHVLRVVPRMPLPSR